MLCYKIQYLHILCLFSIGNRHYVLELFVNYHRNSLLNQSRKCQFMTSKNHIAGCEILTDPPSPLNIALKARTVRGREFIYGCS